MTKVLFLSCPMKNFINYILLQCETESAKCVAYFSARSRDRQTDNQFDTLRLYIDFVRGRSTNPPSAPPLPSPLLVPSLWLPHFHFHLQQVATTAATGAAATVASAAAVGGNEQLQPSCRCQTHALRHIKCNEQMPQPTTSQLLQG